jgi:hypothetical protein
MQIPHSSHPFEELRNLYGDGFIMTGRTRSYFKIMLWHTVCIQYTRYLQVTLFNR